ncbi:MAG: ABC transporter permease [Proteobacteria bacterium]|jgi:peptide/nickel transport system permease protein|nr:ABC transporter permease [Pseudomonadota bacterium]
MSDKQLSQKEIQALEQYLPMWKIVFGQFLQHKMAVVGLITILIFVAIALLAPVISAVTGLDPNRQNPLARYLKPGTVAPLGSSQKEEAVLNFENREPQAAQALRADLMSKQLVQSVREEDALYDLAFLEKNQALEVLKKLKTPEAKKFEKVFDSFETYHLLGTDDTGRDVFIRLVYGTRVSLGIGVVVAIMATLIGLIVGALAGFYGGFIDSALMRITDSLLSLPTIPLLILMAAIKGKDFLEKIGIDEQEYTSSAVLSFLLENEAIIKLVFILLIFSWMTTARLVRGSILSLKEREFILAAKTLGAKDSTIIVRHLFPNVISVILVSVTLKVGDSILFEAAMSFLGLGVQPPTPSWGNMLFNAQDLIQEAPFLAILPGLLILAVTLSFNYLGDGLQDAIDPKAIRR